MGAEEKGDLKRGLLFIFRSRQALLSTGFSAAFAGLFAYNALTVGIGEAAVCFLLGVPLLRALEKRAIA